MLLAIILTCAFIALGSAAAPLDSLNFTRDKEPKIVNGTDATTEEFPFIVSIQWIYNETAAFHSCGGSVLNSWWVLTAAHCLEDTEPEEYLIEYSTTNIAYGSIGEKVTYAEELIMHEGYDEDLDNDIGLIRVKTPMFDDRQFFAKLPIKGQYFATGTPATLAGKTNCCLKLSLMLHDLINRLGSPWD